MLELEFRIIIFTLLFIKSFIITHYVSLLIRMSEYTYIIKEH